MRRNTRVIILTVVLLVILVMSVNANTIALPLIVHKASNGNVNNHTFTATIHGRPVSLYVTVNNDIWTLGVTELDYPTITPTVNPSITPMPSITPTPEYTGQYASLKTSSVYHKVTCSYLAGKDPSELEYYATCEEAQASGKRACSRCKPCPVE